MSNKKTQPEKKSSFEVNPQLIEDIRGILNLARQKAAFAVNSAMVFAYWEIGKRIVEEEQDGQRRAQHGKYLLRDLAKALTKSLGKNFDARELRRIRQLYLYFPNRDAVRPELTWSHYRLLLRIKNDRVRKFYVTESISEHWSTRKLDRNINSQYYQRMLSSQTETQSQPENPVLSHLDFIKNPYVFEFLELPPNQVIKEKDIENGIVDQLQKFILELGKGFAFIGRQKRIRTESSDFYIDLVFYNYYLKCFFIIDIKTGKLTHQDIGQLDMYTRMFDALEKSPTDNPTIGLLLCADTDNVVAKYSVLNDKKNLFASKYQMYLPTEKELEQFMESEPTAYGSMN